MQALLPRHHRLTSPRNLKKKALSTWALGAAMALFLVGSSAQAQQVNYMPRGKKNFHKVVDGDTLYDLSGRYTGEVYNWPQIWSYNPHITNPHWIYPGDIIYLKPPGDQSGTGLQTITSRPVQASELHLAVGGFIAKEEVEYVGRIVASPKQATMLGEHDTVWVGFGDEAYTEEEKEEIKEDDRQAFQQTEGEIKVGDTYAIVRPVGKVTAKDDDDTVVGHKYIMLGSLQVQEVSEKYLNTATITQSWFEIERGDLLVPYEQQLKQVQLIQSEQNLVAEIADTVEPRSVLGEMHYVLINKGAEDDVRVGNRFYIFQKREGLQKIDEVADEKIPWQRIGQVLVIDIKENYSTGIIIDSTIEVLVGDRLEMYEGY